VRATRDGLDTVLDALIGNVFDHTPPSSGLSITVSADEALGRLVVEDDGGGSGAPSPSRGARGDTSRGTGLGLDIVRSVAEAASGALRVAPRPGGGTRVEVSFALGAAPSPAATDRVP
jgi:signal transduction histidine kinase